MNIEISKEVAELCPELCVLAIRARVNNTPYDETLWKEIAETEQYIRATAKLEDVNKLGPIQATRKAYKKMGKDPNRYRPSAEALHRRIHRNLPLYQINTLVDLINLVSIRSGFSIGGFDADKIVGDLVLGIGRAGESYYGIGRGELNIEGLPVYRDALSGIGTPTSDEERTKINLDTTNLLMLINAYSGQEGLGDSGRWAVNCLKEYVLADDVSIQLITPKLKKVFTCF
ncbi:MAG: phenylalanine--tRNA ligase beta subunit-related protein [Massilibacteroides sp.]|nr:phenylalanine--tRNA ligase beta subunit-related protein [Massilibacteroides sp.]MDD3063882.1 phenylalanine--tRNA ligase beta subunit-related protein [Massilibacteroides sp.]MDD4115696.1 phenylalanine--tRNA ligase beta subunit-related protein [Massilibacteroides sp.]MDD4661361.1 phenylalanine--tRNA ligase beta subunit-related protein [Massilibacteroides sp.]